MMTMILNMGSLVIGIGAWVFAGMAFMSKNERASYRHSMVSFCMCIIALAAQLVEVGNRAKHGDFAAIDDTIGAVIMAAVVLSVVTVVLNAATLWKVHRVEKSDRETK